MTGGYYCSVVFYSMMILWRYHSDTMPYVDVFCQRDIHSVWWAHHYHWSTRSITHVTAFSNPVVLYSLFGIPLMTVLRACRYTIQYRAWEPDFDVLLISITAFCHAARTGWRTPLCAHAYTRCYVPVFTDGVGVLRDAAVQVFSRSNILVPLYELFYYLPLCPSVVLYSVRIYDFRAVLILCCTFLPSVLCSDPTLHYYCSFTRYCYCVPQVYVLRLPAPRCTLPYYNAQPAIVLYPHFYAIWADIACVIPVTAFFSHHWLCHFILWCLPFYAIDCLPSLPCRYIAMMPCDANFTTIATSCWLWWANLLFNITGRHWSDVPDVVECTGEFYYFLQTFIAGATPRCACTRLPDVLHHYLAVEHWCRLFIRYVLLPRAQLHRISVHHFVTHTVAWHHTFCHSTRYLIRCIPTHTFHATLSIEFVLGVPLWLFLLPLRRCLLCVPCLFSDSSCRYHAFVYCCSTVPVQGYLFDSINVVVPIVFLLLLTYYSVLILCTAMPVLLMLMWRWYTHLFDRWVCIPFNACHATTHSPLPGLAIWYRVWYDDSLFHDDGNLLIQISFCCKPPDVLLMMLLFYYYYYDGNGDHYSHRLWKFLMLLVTMTGIRCCSFSMQWLFLLPPDTILHSGNLIYYTLMMQ